MPGPVDGLMLAKFATERWPHLWVIVISGQQKADATDLPDDTAFLSKPFDLEDNSRLMAGFDNGQAQADDDSKVGSYD